MNSTIRTAGILGTVAAIVLTGILLAAFMFHTEHAEATAGGSDVTFIKGTVASSTDVTTTSKTLFATSTSRTYAIVCNDSSGTAPVFLNFGNSAVNDAGIRISAGTCYEIAMGNRFTGAINVIASSTAKVTGIEVNGAQTFGN